MYVSKITPNEFTLKQAYPNPFNPVNKIQFDLPKSVFVSLKVYNVLGEEVATLLEENREAGRHDVEFSGSKLPSGVYYYRLTAGSNVDTKKLLLLR
jgi:hypothetical protein